MFKSFSELRQHKDKITSKGLHTAIIYFRSPIDGEIIERHIYADDYMEVSKWLDNITTKYREANFTFITYLDNHIQEMNGKEFEKSIQS